MRKIIEAGQIALWVTYGAVIGNPYRGVSITAITIAVICIQLVLCLTRKLGENENDKRI